MTAPYLQDQSPAPGSTSNPYDASVSVGVVDDQGDLDAATVRLYVGGTLAWTGGRVMPGFVVSAEAVSSPAGMAYEVAAPGGAWEPGTQTVRVTASDAQALTLDESWSFATAAQVVTDEDAEQEADAAVYIDLRLDTSHDVAVAAYDLELVAGADEVAQHLLVGLRLCWGEWFLDDEAGIPYYRDVLINSPSSRVIEGLFRQAILGDPDVESLSSFALELDRATRHLDVSFVAVSSVGVVDVSTIFPAAGA